MNFAKLWDKTSTTFKRETVFRATVSCLFKVTYIALPSKYFPPDMQQTIRTHKCPILWQSLERRSHSFVKKRPSNDIPQPIKRKSEMFDSVKDAGQIAIIVLLHETSGYPHLLMRNKVQTLNQFSVCKQYTIQKTKLLLCNVNKTILRNNFIPTFKFPTDLICRISSGGIPCSGTFQIRQQACFNE
jgi:hypothetical protein